MTRRREIGGHGPTHVTKSDKSDLHARTLLFKRQLVLAQRAQHERDINRRHFVQCMFPFGGAIFVDYCGANAFKKIAVFHRACGVAVFKFEGALQICCSAQTVDHFDRAGHGKGRVARYLFQRMCRKFRRVLAQVCADITKAFTAEMARDLLHMLCNRGLRRCRKERLGRVNIPALEKYRLERCP